MMIEYDCNFVPTPVDFVNERPNYVAHHVQFLAMEKEFHDERPLFHHIM